MLIVHVPRVVKLKMGKEKKKVTLQKKSTLGGFSTLFSQQGESGIATTYLSRSQALRKLQISMSEFR